MPETQPFADQRPLRDKLAEALLRQRHGLVRPLWADRSYEMRLPWLHEADVFLVLARECGFIITDAAAIASVCSVINGVAMVITDPGHPGTPVPVPLQDAPGAQIEGHTGTPGVTA
jgi:hypothetical protein